MPRPDGDEMGVQHPDDAWLETMVIMRMKAG